nr:MAG TPA: hypothetical protein [Caudoviricetes sp.]
MYFRLLQIFHCLMSSFLTSARVFIKTIKHDRLDLYKSLHG